jgi:hypothetical protein
LSAVVAHACPVLPRIDELPTLFGNCLTSPTAAAHISVSTHPRATNRRSKKKKTQNVIKNEQAPKKEKPIYD